MQVKHNKILLWCYGSDFFANILIFLLTPIYSPWTAYIYVLKNYVVICNVSKAKRDLVITPALLIMYSHCHTL